VQRREYKDYAAYVKHQKEKTTNPEMRTVWQKRFERNKSHFLEFFEVLKGRLPYGCRALCVGARFGAEVVALRDLGYDAIGIDLVPCPPFVVEGDFHEMVFGNDSFVLVYSNSLDHVYDIDRFCSEVKRVLIPGGLIFFHVAVKAWRSYESLWIESVDEIIVRFPEFEVCHEHQYIMDKEGKYNHEVLLKDRKPLHSGKVSFVDDWTRTGRGRRG